MLGLLPSLHNFLRRNRVSYSPLGNNTSSLESIHAIDIALKDIPDSDYFLAALSTYERSSSQPFFKKNGIQETDSCFHIELRTELPNLKDEIIHVFTEYKIFDAQQIKQFDQAWSNRLTEQETTAGSFKIS